MKERVRIRGTAPVGPLAEVLQRYGAPEPDQRAIARRVGAVVGTGVPVSRIEGIITDSMDRRGRPDWVRVQDRVGDEARAVYSSYRKA